MSIKRYTAAGEGIVRTDANGELVLFSDYSRLKTEVERLDTLCKQLMAQHSDISCENIILRKAGDAMYVVIYGFNWLAFNKDITNTLNAWNAAKEGKGQP